MLMILLVTKTPVCTFDKYFQQELKKSLNKVSPYTRLLNSIGSKLVAVSTDKLGSLDIGVANIVVLNYHDICTLTYVGMFNSWFLVESRQ